MDPTDIPDDGLPESQEELPVISTLPVSEPLIIQASANTYSGTAVLPVIFSCSVWGESNPTAILGTLMPGMTYRLISITVMLPSFSLKPERIG